MSTGIFSNDHNNTHPHLKSISSPNGPLKLLIKNGRFCIDFNGNYTKHLNFSAIDIYSLDQISNTRNTDFTAQNCLFSTVKITKNRNTSKYKYVGYGTCFGESSNFSFGNRMDAKNVILLGYDAKNSPLVNNKKSNIIVLGEDFIQELTTDGTGNTIYVDKIYKTNMTEPNKKFVLSLHYNGNNSYFFVNGKEELKFKAQSFTNTMKSQLFCIGNSSTNWTSAENPKT